MTQPKITTSDAYPLKWPDGWSRTPPAHRKPNGRYDVTFARARNELLRSLRILGATDVVISSDVPLRRDGQPYAVDQDDPGPRDPGVAVYWQQGRKSRVMACDCWDTVRDNIRAVGLTVDAMRAMQRAGASDLLDRAFQGFTALPALSATPKWQFVLFPEGLPAPFDLGTIERRYKELAQQRHPDKPSGSHVAFAELQAAVEAARAELGEAAP